MLCPTTVHYYVAAEMDAMPKEVDTQDEEGMNTDSEAKAAALFIQHMKDNSFSQQLAVKALKAAVDPAEFDEGS